MVEACPARSARPGPCSRGSPPGDRRSPFPSPCRASHMLRPLGHRPRAPRRAQPGPGCPGRCGVTGPEHQHAQPRHGCGRLGICNCARGLDQADNEDGGVELALLRGRSHRCETIRQGRAGPAALAHWQRSDRPGGPRLLPRGCRPAARQRPWRRCRDSMRSRGGRHCSSARWASRPGSMGPWRPAPRRPRRPRCAPCR